MECECGVNLSCTDQKVKFAFSIWSCTSLVFVRVPVVAHAVVEREFQLRLSGSPLVIVRDSGARTANLSLARA